MRQPRHTPGPWAIDAGFLEAQGHAPLFQLFGTCDCGEPIGQITGTQEEAEANARLIAAAPQLLEACQLALSEAVADDQDEWYANMRKAIAAATGDA